MTNNNKFFSKMLDKIEKKYECTECHTYFDSQRKALQHFKEEHVKVKD